jgi:hypothetical protein
MAIIDHLEQVSTEMVINFAFSEGKVKEITTSYSKKTNKDYKPSIQKYHSVSLVSKDLSKESRVDKLIKKLNSDI